MDRHL